MAAKFGNLRVIVYVMLLKLREYRDSPLYVHPGYRTISYFRTQPFKSEKKIEKNEKMNTAVSLNSARTSVYGRRRTTFPAYPSPPHPPAPRCVAHRASALYVTSLD